mgnify:CR=1 FL=1
MDRVAGLDTPKTPGWSLNTTTDYLILITLKKDSREISKKELYEKSRNT